MSSQNPNYQKEIESLRQQLAEATAARDRWIDNTKTATRMKLTAQAERDALKAELQTLKYKL